MCELKSDIIRWMLNYCDNWKDCDRQLLKKTLAKIPAVVLRKCFFTTPGTKVINAGVRFKERTIRIVRYHYTPLVALSMYPEYFDEHLRTIIRTEL